MDKIFSKSEPGVLLHIVMRMDDILQQKGFREEIVPGENFIQCASLNMMTGKTFKPHRHISKQRTHYNQVAQESWVCIRGSVKCMLYDLDDTIIATPVLYPGDASFTLRGGHTYLILEDGTIVYEYKTGPYEGQQFDKTFIE